MGTEPDTRSEHSPDWLGMVRVATGFREERTRPGGVMAAYFIEVLNPFTGPFGGEPSLGCMAAGAALAGLAMWHQRRTRRAVGGLPAAPPAADHSTPCCSWPAWPPSPQASWACAPSTDPPPTWEK